MPWRRCASWWPRPRALGIDPTRIAVGGDSAGGNLAAVLALMARDGTVPAPGFQLLLYPATDLAGNTPSTSALHRGLSADRGDHALVHRSLCARAASSASTGAPRRCGAPSLAGTPPAFVMTCGHDPLVDEGIAYARRLDEEGVRVTHLHVADQMHGYLAMGRLVPAADLTLRQAAAALRLHWGPD